jgi:hypothetical protein
VKFNGRYRRVNASLHGSGDLDVDVGNSDRVTAALVGSGALTLAGSCADLKAEASGSGEFDAQHLRADAVSVRQSGTGSTSVTAQKSVAVTMSGTGDIEVGGNPAQRSVSRSGNGEVTFTE